MSPLTDRQLAKKLRPDSRPEPPAGLLDELRRQIPAEVKAPAPADSGTVLPFRRPLPRRVWLAAASIVTLVGGGALSYLALRHNVAEQRVAEPVQAANEDFDHESPAETRAGSAEATQPQDLSALGYAGAPSAAPPASAPAYPGLARQRQAAAPAEAMRARPRVPTPDFMVKPPTAPPPVSNPRFEGGLYEEQAKTAPSAAAPPAARDREEITVTSESPLLDERRISTGATVSQSELSNIPVQAQSARGGAQGGRVAGNEAAGAKPVTTREGSLWRSDAAAAAPAPEPVAAAPPATAVPPPPPPPPPPPTGGTAEPNDQPNGDVFFKSSGVDPFVDSDDDRLSTFALDVDTGSYNVVRRYLNDGRLPPSDAVRVEELVNAFDYGDAPPSKGDFALTAEAAPDPWTPGGRYVLARFAVKARQVPRRAGNDTTGTPQAIAQEARAQVEVDPRVVSYWRLLGYENPDAAIDAGKMSAGDAVTALYELELRPDAPRSATLAVLHLRWRPADGGKFQEIHQPLHGSAVAKTWESASRGFRLATVVGRFAEVLRGSYWAKQGAHGDDLAELARRAAQVSEDWPRQERVAELVSLIGRASELRPR